MTFDLSKDAGLEAVNAVRTLLQQYNAEFWETKDRTTDVLRAEDEGGLVGGIVFEQFGIWLEVEYLIMLERYRGEGLGSELLKRCENHARNNDCRKVLLNTMDFQARGFYEKHGYAVVYEQKQYPMSGSRYFMEKDL